MMESRRRILLITTFYPPHSFGGDAVYSWRLANALAQDGHLVDVIHCADSYELLAGSRLLPKPLPSHPNVSVHPLRSSFPLLVSLAGHQSGFPVGRGSRIAAVIGNKEYDVIHFNNISLFGPGILGLTPPGRKPIKLLSVLEYWLVCPAHLLWKFGDRPCDSEQCLECVIRSRRPPQLWRHTGLLERMAAEVDGFLVPSRAVSRIHAERGFPMETQHHLPLFTEVPEDDELSSFGEPFGEPYFLFAGRLEPLKGLEDLLAAWQRVGNCRLVIAGDGSQLESLRRRTAGAPGIQVLGHVSPPDLAGLYRHARACIVPSSFEEPFGLAAIEALAYRTPVIARDIGGLREIVGESGGGLLFQTVAQLTESILRLREDDALRESLARRGYRACAQHWSRPAHLRRYYQIVSGIEATKDRSVSPSLSESRR